MRWIVAGSIAAASLAAQPAIARDAAPWTVLVDGRDQTRSADPIEVGGEVLVDLVGLAPALGLVVRFSPTLSIVDRGGVRWEAATGGDLVRRGEMLRLGGQQRTATSWHVTSGIAARLSGHEVVVGRAGAPAAAGDSWQPITLAKTAEELAAAARFAAAHRAPVRSHEVRLPPPARQTARATVGVGYRDGGEWGAEISAHGLWSDWNVQLWGAAATGPARSGFEGHLFVEHPDRTWSLEAGNLHSETTGTIRGVRMGRILPRHRPTVSLYLPDAPGEDHQPVAAYRDMVTLGPTTTVAGEVTSEGRWALTGNLRRGWFAGSLHARDGAGAAVRGASVFLDRGELVVAGSYYRSEDSGLRLETQNLQVRLPRRGRLDSALEAWGSRSDRSRSSAQGAVVSLPLGGQRVRVRFTTRTTEWTPPGRPSQNRDHQEVQALLASGGGGRLHYDVRWTGGWPDDGEAFHRADVHASYRFATGTRVQVFGGFTNLDRLPDRYLFRLTQELPRDLLVGLELGDTLGFPVGDDLLPKGVEPGRVKFVVQRSFDVATPAAGGTVAGRVLAPGALPLSDVAVRLGPYRVFTDLAGRYVFSKVPVGRYELSLESEGLPAHVQATGAALALEVRRGQRHDQNLFVVPLSTVSGRVFVDSDRDGISDPNEGVGGIVMTLGEQAKATARDGSFAFHGLPEGRYVLEVVKDRLPRDLAAAAPFRFDIGLTAGKSLDHLAVRLMPVERPIAFQELP